jgi:hypothetical protein
MADVTIKQRFQKLDSVRAAVLARGRQCAELTIPSLLPPLGHTEAAELPTPWQGLGARGVNNLASKLLLALLPPNSPFFRLKVDDRTLAEIAQDEETKTQVESSLSSIERNIMDEIEVQAIRISAFEALKYLVTTGNALAYLDDDGGMRVFRLDQYCVKRDPKGNLLELVTAEKVSPIVLPEEIRGLIKKDHNKPEDMVDLYTRVVRTATNWEVAQEVVDTIIPSSRGSYPLTKSPWIALRWTGINGEDYGRGLVEEYLGDLRSLDILMQAIVEGSAAAAKVLFLSNPNGITDPKKLSAARNCDFVPGNADDITTIQTEKFADFKVALDTVAKLEERLSAAFMLNTSVQRQAERVTAEEIRYMARELEDALGGVYSILSQEFQLPLVTRIKLQMEKAGKLPALPGDQIKLVITTGLEALGRNHDLTKLNQFMSEMEPVAEPLLGILNVRNYADRVATSTGVDIKGLLITKDEEKAQAQQAQQAAMLENMMASNAAGQVAKGVMESPGMQQRMGGGQPAQ